MQHHSLPDAFTVLQGPLGADLRAQLAPHENVQAALAVDLGADHAFNRDPEPPFQPEAAALAWRRTLDFFTEHLR